MRVCGIIAEYDPLHNGHARQIAQARRFSHADTIVCAMSGYFTQRGQPALLAPHPRAEMALAAGADVVLGLPFSFSVCDAERFALGGVSLLKKAGANCLSFGIESSGLAIYRQAADLLESPSEAFRALLRQNLDKGLPFPRAQGEALAAQLNVDPDILSKPNTVLAICYVRANLRLQAHLEFFPIERRGDYHSTALPSASAALPSASAVRKAVYAEQWEDVQAAMPPAAFAILRKAYQAQALQKNGALDDLLRWKIRNTRDLSSLPDISEGIENRLYLAENCLTRNEMVQTIRSKRYPYARVNRMLTHLLLHTDKQVLSPLPQHAYVYAFRQSAAEIFKTAKQNELRLLPAVSYSESDPEVLLDARAADLWALGASSAFGALYRTKPVII